MKVELKLDPECRETSVLVRTDRMTEDTERLLRKLRAWSEPMLLGFRGEAASPLDDQPHLRPTGARLRRDR